MTTYSNVFNGNFVQPSSVSYLNIELTSNIQLSWPTSYLDNSTNTVLAKNMTVQASAQTPIITNLANNPISTTIGIANVSVSAPSTSNLFVGTPITVSGATTFNNITGAQLNITSNILGLSGGSSFIYASNGIANASSPPSGGGNSVVLTYSVPYAIILPNATQVSNGQSTRFINNGSNPFFITDNAQNFLVTLNPGNVYDIILTDNTTPGGEWQILQAGTGTASSNASALAGLGLTAINGTLNYDFQSKSINSNYTAVLSDRGSLLVWTGGVGTITLPTVGTVAPKGYSLSVNNSGGGIVTIQTPDATTIDGLSTFPLNPGESAEFILTSPNWNTLGFGTETFFAVNALSLDVSAGGTFNLSNQQSSRLVQTYTGALASNVTITYPAATGQWYVWNDTTNAHTITLQLFGAGGGFVIPQGEKLIVYSDGTNLYFTPTTATNAIFNPGSVGSPTIVFTNDGTTGFYSFGGGDFGYSSSGTLSLNLAGYGLGVKAAGATRYYNAANTHYAAIQGGNTTSNVTWTLPLSDATTSGQILFSNASGTLSFTTAVYPTSTTANQILYSSATNTITGLATVNNSVLTTSAAGVPIYLTSVNNATLVTSGAGLPSLSTTLPTAVQTNITQLGTITVGTWNGTSITVPHGGTGLSTLTTAYGVVCAGTTATGNLQNAGTGTTGQILISQGNASLPKWVTNLSSQVLQVVKSSTNSNITSNNTFPLTSLPQNTDGVEILTCSITPKNSGSTLYIRWSGFFGTSNASSIMGVGLYRDTTANALNAQYTDNGSGTMFNTFLEWYVTSGSTTATTFKIRAGTFNGGVALLNSYNGTTPTGGGVSYAILEIWEIAP